MAMRADGHFVVAWSEAETPGAADSFFNIALALFAPNGMMLDEIAGPTDNEWVNIPALEIGPSDQLSPAVAFDDAGNIVATWVSTPLSGCGDPGERRIFARRFFWDGNQQSPIQSRSSVFLVQSDPDSSPVSASLANPTVSLSSVTDPQSSLVGQFIIAWNAQRPGMPAEPDIEEVRAQFFDANGDPIAQEFILNNDTGPTVSDPFGPLANARRLANSAQHTVIYGPSGEVVATWTAYGEFNGPVRIPLDVHFTRLPPGFSDSLGEACCKADVNGNGLRDGLDIQPFVDLLLNPTPADPCQSLVEQYLLICPADMDSDGDVDVDDVPLFVAALLDTIPCAMSGFNPGASADCNSNGRPDATDVFFGTSQDCNLNGVPDECDISSQSSGDVNGNGVPDECEADCNGNGVPDDKDIADGTSGDVNSNGVPDECDPDCNGNGTPDDWDLSQGTSPDCNNNGVPDDCEEDCNGNGVPDDCDIDPADPDGDGLVSADCNGNNWPDECDLAVPPPFGSLDCDNNGVPDECDIAGCQGDPACGDCNGNGVPDACDISSGISADADANGIPDECEGQQAQGGGSGGAATLEAYTAFYNWCFAQQWGPHAGCTCGEQFQGMVNMEQALGLPLGDPKYLPVPQE